MQRDDVLNLRVPRDLKAALKKAAAKDERSMSMLAVRILRVWLLSNGFYDAKPVGLPPRSSRRTRQ